MLESNDTTLDLFSTSPTDLCSFPVLPPKSIKPCSYGAPYFAYQQIQKSYGVVQGCCNHWDCPRCGIQRAKHEYGRIVEGCRTLQMHNILWFYTLTCRGKELKRNDALKGYLGWTNKFLDSFRAYSKRSGYSWEYVQVTELQKRGHPHSHVLSTTPPPDIYEVLQKKWEVNSMGSRVYTKKKALRSEWFDKNIRLAGLGEQYDISFVETVEGASRYVAKYLFKDTAFDAQWPKGWKRVRYSQSFPKLPERKTDAFVLLASEDYVKLARLAVVLNTDSGETKTWLKKVMRGHDVIIR